MWFKLPLLVLLFFITLTICTEAKKSLKNRPTNSQLDERPQQKRKPIINGGNNRKMPMGREVPAVDKKPVNGGDKKPMNGGDKKPSNGGKEPAVAKSDKKLVYVQGIWRHGDRAPGFLPYPNDKNGEENWPRGWNQLTNEGMRQLKDLGQFMRKRYIGGNFVNRTFSEKEILIQSTDKARAIVSAQSLLNGFFPPASHEAFEEGLNWHPIPVHSNGIGNEDPLLKPTQFVCPAYDDEVKDVQRQFMKNLFLSNAEFYKFVRQNAGFDNFGLEELKSLAEASKEVDHGMKQPDWLMKKWKNGKTTLELVKEDALAERLSRLSTPKLAKLRGGFLLGDFLDRAVKVMKGKQKSPRKMMLYSSHDGTLQSFLHVLGVADGLQVPYGAAVFMEVYANRDSQHSVKLLFRHGKEVSLLKVKGCGEECSVDKFMEVLASRAFFTKKELYEACDRDDFCAPTAQESVNADKKKAKKQRRRFNSSRG